MGHWRGISVRDGVPLADLAVSGMAPAMSGSPVVRAQDGQLIALEEEARAANRGLWRDPAAVEPWLWRERNDVARHRSPRARTQ